MRILPESQRSRFLVRRQSSPSDTWLLGPPASRLWKNSFILFQVTKCVVIGYSGPGKLKLPKCLILKAILRDKQNRQQKRKICDKSVLRYTSKASKEVIHLSMYHTFFLQVSSSQCGNDLQMGKQVLLSNKKKPA